MTTASLDIWKDTGYTEGCLEVPKTTSTLPNPDYSFDGLEISTSSLFSEVKVRGEFAALFECSYLRMSIEMNNGDDVTVYGWIDSVAVGSDSAGSPMTRIQWHVDLWRSYISKVALGSGIVKRRTAEGTLPAQPYGPRYSLAGTPRQLIAASTIRWVFVNCTQMVDSKAITKTLCYPVDSAYPDERLVGCVTSPTVDPLYAPSFSETMYGKYDELFGMDPDAIYSAFISPVAPCEYTIQGDVYIPTGGGWVGEVFTSIDGESIGAWVNNPSSFAATYTARKFSTMAQTTDITSYIVTDFDHEPVGALPWGISVSGGSYRIVNCDTSMYLSIRFTSSVSDFDDAPLNGLEYNIPLKTIAAATNAKSSYLYSGQQELDRQQMALQREQALLSGTANTANQAIQGAMSGALIGGISTGGLGLLPGALIGGVSSAVGSSISTAADYAISGMINDKLMDATISQKAQQTPSLTLPSSGTDWVVFGAMPELVPFQWDDYSVTQRSQDMALYGAHVDEPRASCQSLLTAGGPLQIANCTVTGSVPVQAKRYIKDRLSNGVRIV